MTLGLRSVHAKMVLSTGAALLVCLGLSTWFTIRTQRRQLYQAKRRDFLLVAEMVEGALAHAMEEGRVSEVQRIMSTLGARPEIVRLRIFSPQGVVLRSARPEERGRRVEPHVLRSYARGLQTFTARERLPEGTLPAFSVLKPIPNGRRCWRCHGRDAQVLGVLQVGIDLRPLRRELALICRSTAVTFLLTLLVLGAVGVWLQRTFISRPLGELTARMEEAQRGNLNVRARVSSRDEFGRLGESFNRMVERLQEAARRAAHLASIGEFAAGIAHEVRNPLAGIGGAMQVLLAELPPGDPRRSVLEEVLQEIERLERFLQDLLAYARPARPSPRPVRAEELVEEALRFVDPKLLAGRTLRREIAPDLPPLRVDPGQMAAALRNVIVNGLQAMEGGTLTIRARAEGDWARISVRDQGPGIPPEDLERIFRPFFSTKEGGTGLGLAIVQRVVENHAGRVEVWSRPGEGAEFSILLPLREDGLGEGPARGG